MITPYAQKRLLSKQTTQKIKLVIEICGIKNDTLGLARTPGPPGGRTRCFILWKSNKQESSHPM